MAKRIDLNKTVYELTQEYPELIKIMKELGFTEITKKLALNSVGKLMTIPKGAKLKNIPMTKVVTALISNGFELVGEIPFDQEEANASKQLSDDRTEQLKTLLKRL